MFPCLKTLCRFEPPPNLVFYICSDEGQDSMTNSHDGKTFNFGSNVRDFFTLYVRNNGNGTSILPYFLVKQHVNGGVVTLFQNDTL